MGLVTAVRGATVSVAANAMYCSAAAPWQCLTRWTGASAAIVTLGGITWVAGTAKVRAAAMRPPLCKVALCTGSSCAPPVYSAQASAAETAATGAQGFQPSPGAHLSEVDETGPGISAFLQSKLAGRCHGLSLDVA